MRHTFFLVIIVVFSIKMMAQHTISGTILTANEHVPVPMAHILLKNDSAGVVSDEKGNFNLNTPHPSGEIMISALGYNSKTISYGNRLDYSVGTVYLEDEAFDLNEVIISSGLVNKSETPITVSRIQSITIQQELGDKPLPFAMDGIPGVYSVRTGGGSGDADISIRGFNQENIGVLLNGIPINGVENGLVYWSNWLGLNNAAAEIQVQKGPGYSIAGSNSVGGSINIITKPGSAKKSGSVIYQLTSYGNQVINVALNSGKLKNGWSISALGSYMFGKGYIDATYVRGWSYYLAMDKDLDNRNHISITLMGAPQRHGQRTLKLSSDENDRYGPLFNKDWGSIDGTINNASENFYHRPVLSVNHDFKITDTKKLSSAVYVITGNGGGKWSESFNYAPSIFSYRTYSNQINWDTIYVNNATHTDTYTLANGETVSGYSKNIQTNFLASHIETGFLSNYEQSLGKKLTFLAGIHYRYFNSFLREEVDDLLGGDFFIEDYSWSVNGVSGREQIKMPGDIIKVNNHSVINFINAYSQLRYAGNKLNSFLTLTINNNWYKRTDNYNYPANPTSDLLSFPGFDVRAGISYSPSIAHAIYANGAYISKAPYFKYVFGNFTNVPVQSIENENILTVEAGYRFENERFATNINGYFTQWDNVSMLSNEYVQLEDNTQTRAMINGLSSQHYGVEGTFSTTLARNLSVGAIFSLGDYKWTNNVSAQLFNDNNVAVDTVNVYAKGLFVGGTAQQQFGCYFSVRILRFMNLKAEWSYYNRIWANFDPTSRNDANDREQPYRIPSYQLLNAYLGIPFSIGNQVVQLRVNGYNLLNSNYIEWGEDGTGHDLDTFKGFWSFKRTFDFMLKISF